MTRSGADVLAEQLSGYGVTHFFMVPAVLRKTMMALELQTDIVRIHAHGEKAAAYMADGYARTTGRPGVCGAQVVGALNLAAGLRDAWLAHSPVIALTGGRDPATKFKNVYQEVDDVPAFEPVTKMNATIDDVDRIPDMVAQAFRVATTGCPGPVHLQFRGNEGQLDREDAAVDARVEPRFASVPPFRPAPDGADVRACLDLFERSERPVIVAGGGVRLSGACGELRRFAEALSVPVATSLNGRECMPDTHHLSVGVPGAYARSCANEVVRLADFVCFVGSSAGSMTTHSWTAPKPGVRVAQIDLEPSEIGRNYPLNAAIHADAKAALEALTAMAGAGGRERRADWLEEVAAIKARWRERQSAVMSSEAVPIRPERLCATLTDTVPEDAIVVVDTGHAGMWMAGYFDLRHDGQSFMRSCGHLGWAFPAGLGAKSGAPERPVVVFTGDAGLWYHVAELETAVRWGINCVIVVNNNGAGNQSKRGFDRAYGGNPTQRSRELWTYRPVDFAQLASSIGAFGVRVSTPRQLPGAMEQAIHAGRPAVVDVVTDVEALAPLMEQ